MHCFYGIFEPENREFEEMKDTTWLKIYKFSFWAYLASLLVLVAFNFWGNAAAGYAGEDVGLDPMTIAFLIIAASTIILSIIILLPGLSLRVKHAIHYIISVLIFVILLFDAWWLYNEISDQDYTPFFGFFIFFVFVSAISFYALVKKKI